MSDEKKSDTHLESEEALEVYELGIHLVPTVSESEVGSEFEKLKSVLQEAKGVFVSQEVPELRPLLYPITKHTSGKNVKYSEAYFGWVKFIMPRDGVTQFQEHMKEYPRVLRHLLIKTVKENTMSGGRFMQEKTESAPIQTPKKVQKEELTTASIAEIDKEIEGLIIE